MEMWMNKLHKETDARIRIDRLLREAGWDIEDKNQVSTEEAAADGRADYLLKDTQSRPLAIVEAKRFSVDPNRAQDQVKEYAKYALINGTVQEKRDIILAFNKQLYIRDRSIVSSKSY